MKCLNPGDIAEEGELRMEMEVGQQDSPGSDGYILRAENGEAFL